MTNQMMVVGNQYAIWGITTGIALVLVTALAYLAIWHPRLSRKYWVTEQSRWRDVFESVPWILVFTIAGIAIMTVIVLIYYAFNPPNW